MEYDLVAELRQDFVYIFSKQGIDELNLDHLPHCTKYKSRYPFAELKYHLRSPGD